MIDKPKKLSETGRALLTAAAARDDHLIRPPQLPTAAARQVVRSLLNTGVAEEIPAPIEDAAYAWRTSEAGGVLMLRATAPGLAHLAEPGSVPPSSVLVKSEATVAPEQSVGTVAIPAGTGTAVVQSLEDLSSRMGAHAQDPQVRPDGAPEQEDAQVSNQAAVRPEATVVEPQRSGRSDPLRRAVEALLAAWNQWALAHEGFPQAMHESIINLRDALSATRSVSAAVNSPRMPRDTKQAQVLAMLRRKEGASGPQIAEAMGWAPHTVRGFLAGLGKKGINIAVLERVRQVGPNKNGAKGSYTVYHLVDEAQA